VVLLARYLDIHIGVPYKVILDKVTWNVTSVADPGIKTCGTSQQKL
jgi:hypothetical protein